MGQLMPVKLQMENGLLTEMNIFHLPLQLMESQSQKMGRKLS